MSSAAFHYRSSHSRVEYRTKPIHQPCHQRIFGSSCPPTNPLQRVGCIAKGSADLHSSVRLAAIPSSDLDGGVFSAEDIVIGLILGILLALMTSFLQGRRSQNDFVLWNKESENKVKLSSSSISLANDTELDIADNSKTVSVDSSMSGESVEESRSTVVFDGDDWKEMSRPENYVYYKRNLNKKKESTPQTNEQKWVIVALLALFVPIFSVEFFFALSRQVLCGGGDHGLLSSLEAASYLCSPVR